jgi:hypothetical protein
VAASRPLPIGKTALFLSPVSRIPTLPYLSPQPTCAFFVAQPHLSLPPHPNTEHICEGLDHADAGPLDKEAATQQLRRAVTHELAKRRAREEGAAAGARSGGGGGGGGS